MDMNRMEMTALPPMWMLMNFTISVKRYNLEPINDSLYLSHLQHQCFLQRFSGCFTVKHPQRSWKQFNESVWIFYYREYFVAFVLYSISTQISCFLNISLPLGAYEFASAKNSEMFFCCPLPYFFQLFKPVFYSDCYDHSAIFHIFHRTETLTLGMCCSTCKTFSWLVKSVAAIYSGLTQSREISL